jgi:hypothetical protein
MMKADEAKRITNEAIEKQKENDKKILESFLIEAEKEIKGTAEKGQTICYLQIPEAFKYNEYKIIDTFREYGYGAQFDCFEMIKVTW